MAGQTHDRWRSALPMAFAGCLGLALVALWLGGTGGHTPSPQAGTQVLADDDNGPGRLDLAAPQDQASTLVAAGAAGSHTSGVGCRPSLAARAVSFVSIRAEHRKIPSEDDEDPPSARG